MARLMKNSGIQWIGDIPQNWKIQRLKTILKERIEKNEPIKTKNILSLTIHQGVIPISEKVGGGNKPKEDFTSYKLAYPNDIVLNSMNIIVGSVGLSKYFGCVSPVYYVLYSRDNEKYYVNYYNNIFQSSDFQRSLIGLGNGILIKKSDNGNLNTIRMKIPMENLNNVILPLPPIEEQQRIANYLDEKCSKIDETIEKEKTIIEKLKEYKQSLITETVTKGVNPNVPLKDSGIDWIGSIPQHWGMIKIKYLGYAKNGLTYNPKDISDNGVLVLRSSNIVEGNVKFKDNVFVNIPIDKGLKVKKGDILICSRNGSKKLIGKNAIINEDINASFGAFMMIFRTKHYNYIHKILNSDIFNYYLGTFLTSTINQLTLGNFNNMIVPYTKDIKEQEEIAKYLDEKCNAIENAITQRETLIDKLTQYKKSLIYECVTGKKEV